MQVKILTTFAGFKWGNVYAYSEGQIVEMPIDMAKDYIRERYAEAYTAPEPEKPVKQTMSRRKSANPEGNNDTF